MPGGQYRPELARSYESYFGQSGSARVAPDILGVVILDDASRGPYPPSRAWHGGIKIGPNVGNFSVVGVVNNDPDLGSDSVCVVDRIFVQNLTTAAEFVIGIAPKVGVVSLASGPTRDTDSGKDPTSIIDPAFGNVLIGAGQQGAGVILSQFPITAVGVTAEIPGPFTLRPQGALLICPNALNAGIHMWARGRYYPAP